MAAKERHFGLTPVMCLFWALLSPSAVSAGFEDQHSVEAIVAALRSPIPPQAVQEARDFDDKLMSGGQFEGGSVYLVTDERSTRVNTLVRRLLEAMGADPQQWVVRVFETDPPIANAFVTGAKYIYVYTGLIDQAASDDELAFVLSHELGHSLLQHRLRAKEDATSVIAGIAVLGALLSKKHQEDFLGFARLTTAAYSRVDEEEADGLAVAIARRAGYDPLRGADFFSRGKRQDDRAWRQTQQQLAQMGGQVQQAQATCQQLSQQYQSSWTYQTPANANRVNAVCRDAENKRLHYNQVVQQYNLAVQQQKANLIFSTHPEPQNRIATIAALADYMQNRRDLPSLARYQQSHRVMVALRQVDSVLLKPPGGAGAPPASAGATAPKAPGDPGLAEQLKQLKRARDEGLITDAEYERKRQQILNRY